MRLTVCWKWVAVDGDTPDERWAGVSAADEAALEVALRLADPAADVVVVTAGPRAAEAALRTASAVGATRLVRLDTPGASSRAIARAVASVAAGSDVVVCGDYSIDRGTGSVPAFLAAELGAAQALGLVEVETGDTADALRVVRRLDGGRRERLHVPTPAVLSVEGSVARLRRASLAATLAARDAWVDVLAGPQEREDEPTIAPYRPRARTMPSPTGDTLDRLRDLLDVGGQVPHADTVTLEPPDAARRILEQLREWGDR